MNWEYLACSGGKKNGWDRSIPAAWALSRKRARICVILTAITEQVSGHD
jgi:hypothetical protein